MLAYRSLFAFTASALLTLSIAPASTYGQFPTPNLTSVFPPGVQAGSSVDATLTGVDLENVQALWFDDPGIQAKHKER